MNIIPVSKSGLANAEWRTYWGSGPLPTAYPFSNSYVSVGDKSRVLPQSNMPGSQAVDPRASLGYGSANYEIIPSNAEMFSKVSSVGGNYFGGNMPNFVSLIAAGLIVFLITKLLSK